MAAMAPHGYATRQVSQVGEWIHSIAPRARLSCVAIRYASGESLIVAIPGVVGGEKPPQVLGNLPPRVALTASESVADRQLARC